MNLGYSGNARRLSLAEAAPSCNHDPAASTITDAQMTPVKIGAPIKAGGVLKIAAAAGLCLSLLLPAAAEARPLGTVDWMPFFGLPYPFGYKYRPPRLECYEFQTVYDPNVGYETVPVWICGGKPPVRARY